MFLCLRAFWTHTDPIFCSVAVIGFEDFKNSEDLRRSGRYTPLDRVNWMARRMGRIPEAVFVFLTGEKYPTESLRKENRRTPSPTMVKLVLSSITSHIKH